MDEMVLVGRPGEDSLTETKEDVEVYVTCSSLDCSMVFRRLDRLVLMLLDYDTLGHLLIYLSIQPLFIQNYITSGFYKLDGEIVRGSDDISNILSSLQGCGMSVEKILARARISQKMDLLALSYDLRKSRASASTT
jgi:hypothetical protein